MASIKLHKKGPSHTDIAMLKLEKRIEYFTGTGVVPICLPQPPYTTAAVRDVWVSGYNFHFHRNVPLEKK